MYIKWKIRKIHGFKLIDPEKEIPEDPVIYILFNGKKIIYVGQTINLKNRMNCNKNFKDTTQIYVKVEEDRKKRLIEETKMILSFKNKRNKKISIDPKWY